MAFLKIIDKISRLIDKILSIIEDFSEIIESFNEIIESTLELIEFHRTSTHTKNPQALIAPGDLARASKSFI